MKIFIVDDSQIICARLVTWLSDLEGAEMAGFAHNAAEAVESIRRVEPDVVILDLRMPGGSGIEVLHAIKELHPAPLVIMVTSAPLSLSRYERKCVASGADFFFDKSNEFQKIGEVLKGLNRAPQQPLSSLPVR
jgi:DNA-binding NarL/FixJ family response regulator